MKNILTLSRGRYFIACIGCYFLSSFVDVDRFCLFSRQAVLIITSHCGMYFLYDYLMWFLINHFSRGHFCVFQSDFFQNYWSVEDWFIENQKISVILRIDWAIILILCFICLWQVHFSTFIRVDMKIRGLGHWHMWLSAM